MTISRSTSSSSRTTHTTTRAEAFSAAVFAIVVTLLVLELHTPTGSDIERHGSLTAALLAAWPSYLAYLATFLTVGVICSITTPLSARSPQWTTSCSGGTRSC